MRDKLYSSFLLFADTTRVSRRWYNVCVERKKKEVNFLQPVLCDEPSDDNLTLKIMPYNFIIIAFNSYIEMSPPPPSLININYNY